MKIVCLPCYQPIQGVDRSRVGARRIEYSEVALLLQKLPALHCFECWTIHRTSMLYDTCHKPHALVLVHSP